MGEYYASLMQPDNPVASCCGDGDAYYADDTVPCAPTDGTDCALVAIITDTRPDTFTYATPGGPRTVRRVHIPAGARIVIPRHKLRRHPIPNPTGHTIVFLGSALWPYCYEPGGGM